MHFLFTRFIKKGKVIGAIGIIYCDNELRLDIFSSTLNYLILINKIILLWQPGILIPHIQKFSLK